MPPSPLFTFPWISFSCDKVTGNKTALKDSQAYPPAWGTGVARLYQKNEEKIKQAACAAKVNDNDDVHIRDLLCVPWGDELWEQANMSSVLEWLIAQAGADVE